MIQFPVSVIIRIVVRLSMITYLSEEKQAASSVGCVRGGSPQKAAQLSTCHRFLTLRVEPVADTMIRILTWKYSTTLCSESSESLMASLVFW